MRTLKLLMLSVLSTSIFIGCTSKTASNEESASKEKTCTYSYVADSTTLEWTAYKFVKRAGVSGTFNHIAVNNAKESESMAGVLTGVDFGIHTASVNSGNAERDPKLVEFFFNKLTNTDAITGKIVSINDGEAVVSITMNDKTVDVVGKLTEVGNKISLAVSIDMTDFEGLGAVASLNEACSVLHTAEDGESKLWPDVSIVISTVVKKECN